MVIIRSKTLIRSDDLKINSRLDCRSPGELLSTTVVDSLVVDNSLGRQPMSRVGTVLSVPLGSELIS